MISVEVWGVGSGVKGLGYGPNDQAAGDHVFDPIRIAQHALVCPHLAQTKTKDKGASMARVLLHPMRMSSLLLRINFGRSAESARFLLCANL
jgi:hypothetical protein